MKPIGIFLVIFGVIVIVYPALISILIGIFFIVVGANILIFWHLSRKGEKDQRFRFGTFEIIRNTPPKK